MKHKKIITSFLVLLSLLCAILYYGYLQSVQNSRQIFVIYIPKIIDETNDFWTTLTNGARMAATEYNVRLVIEAPDNETDYEGQNAMIREAILKRPDIIAISPIDSEMTAEAVLEAREAGIQVLFIDSTLDSMTEEHVIATDNYEAGMNMGNYIRTILDENSKIAIVSHVKNTSTAIEREQGLRDALSNSKDQILETVFSDSNFEKAYFLTLDLLEQNPDITIIAGLNEYSAVGAGKAIEELGLAGQVKVIGFDNSIAAVQYLESGVFDALVIQNAFNMGYLGIESAYKIARNQPVDLFINSGCELITRDTMYTKEGQKLLFSFLNET
ncbi:MAG: substrate-binding domain-containing protein [Lachnospiraceae bacterium]